VHRHYIPLALAASPSRLPTHDVFSVELFRRAVIAAFPRFIVAPFNGKIEADS